MKKIAIILAALFAFAAFAAEGGTETNTNAAAPEKATSEQKMDNKDMKKINNFLNTLHVLSF